MARPQRGLYETLITEALEAELGALADRLTIQRTGLHEEEAADRLALHLCYRRAPELAGVWMQVA